ncbi:hypothetical protein LIER_33444 [Lithospermum erythrorhizon]|uniref:Uncharacterized protein n=1 Tax=Lithospermum erythrorhizon TaxID=34254 RepID=A0AAV3RWP8_LITER
MTIQQMRKQMKDWSLPGIVDYLSYINNEGKPQGQVNNQVNDSPGGGHSDQILQMLKNQESHNQKTSASIKKLEFQIGQLVEAQQKNEFGRFPTQLEQAKSIMTFMYGESEEVEKFGDFSSHHEQEKAIMTMRSEKLLDIGAHGDKKVAVNGRTKCR